MELSTGNGNSGNRRAFVSPVNPIHELIRERWSPRAFSNRPVEHEKIHSLFEAARWAASANNMQPWHFLFATSENPEEHARFASILNERNSAWAQQAPLLILVVSKLYPFPGRSATVCMTQKWQRATW